MMQKALLLFLLFQGFFFKLFSQDIVKAIDQEISSFKLSQLHAQPDTGYRHNPKGERLGIILDTAFFNRRKRLVMFTRNMKYKTSDSLERENRKIIFFLKDNRFKVIEQDLDPEGVLIDTLYFHGDKLIRSNTELGQYGLLAWTSSLKQYKANIEFGKKNKFLQ